MLRRRLKEAESRHSDQSLAIDQLNRDKLGLQRQIDDLKTHYETVLVKQSETLKDHYGEQVRELKVDVNDLLDQNTSLQRS